jgi:hypothetical protein
MLFFRSDKTSPENFLPFVTRISELLSMEQYGRTMTIKKHHLRDFFYYTTKKQ